jgi:hypothetical protein
MARDAGRVGKENRMKRPYEKPAITDLSVPMARAGWVSPGGGESTQGSCVTGITVGTGTGDCQSGFGPSNPTSCGTGQSAGPLVNCISGIGK